MKHADDIEEAVLRVLNPEKIAADLPHRSDTQHHRRREGRSPTATSQREFTSWLAVHREETGRPYPGDRRHKRVEPDRDRLQGGAGRLWVSNDRS